MAIVVVNTEERTKSQERDVHFTLDVTQKHQNPQSYVDMDETQRVKCSLLMFERIFSPLLCGDANILTVVRTIKRIITTYIYH